MHPRLNSIWQSNGYNSCFIRQIPTLEVQTVAF